MHIPNLACRKDSLAKAADEATTDKGEKHNRATNLLANLARAAMNTPERLDANTEI